MYLSVRDDVLVGSSCGCPEQTHLFRGRVGTCSCSRVALADAFESFCVQRVSRLDGSLG